MISGIDAQSKRPGFIGNSVILLVVMVMYPLVGSWLLLLVIGGTAPDPDFAWLTSAVVPRFRIAQVAGQILILGLPVFLLVMLYNRSRSMFSRSNLALLGVRSPVNLTQLFLVMAGMVLLQPLLFSVVELQNMLWPLLGESGREIIRKHENYELILRKIAASNSGLEFLGVVAVLSLTPAVCEELFFRGYIQKNYSCSIGPSWSVLLTGFVFALFHMDMSNLLPLSLLGWYIGYIYMKSENLAVPAVAHGMNNLGALLFLQGGVGFANGTASAANSAVLATWSWWALVLASLGLFYLVMAKFSTISGQHSEGAGRRG